MQFLTRVLSLTKSNSRIVYFTQKRFKSGVTPEKCSTPHSLGLVLGVYSNENDMLDTGQLTPNAAKFNEVRKQFNYFVSMKRNVCCKPYPVIDTKIIQFSKIMFSKCIISSV